MFDLQKEKILPNVPSKPFVVVLDPRFLRRVLGFMFTFKGSETGGDSEDRGLWGELPIPLSYPSTPPFCERDS